MKIKLFTFLLPLTFSIGANAGFISSGGDPTGIIECKNNDELDATYVASFQLDDQGKYTATLTVPLGETSVDSFQGTCEGDEDNLSFSIQCTVPGKHGVSYWVRLFSHNNQRYQATINEIGEIQPQLLAHCRAL